MQAPAATATSASRVFPHIMAALLAGILLIVGLAATSTLTARLTARYIYALANVRHRQKYLGLVTQREALRHDDLLTLYGTSEIDRISLYHARNLFADAPTGFSTFNVGRPGAVVFTTMESVGALGANLRGKKVVISLSPTMFVARKSPNLTDRYNGNFSSLQALTILLSGDLSSNLKADIAKRFLDRPSMLQRNKLVHVTTNLVSKGPLMPRFLYYAVLPAAQLQRLLLEAQDKILVLGHILIDPRWRTTVMRPVPRQLDWSWLVSDATAKFQAQGSTNPFTLEDNWWEAYKTALMAQENRSSDAEFLRDMEQSEAWLDLEPTLRILQELQAQPLILSMPFHGKYLDYAGVSAAARAKYYARVRELAARYGARTAILDDHEYDPYFLRDLGSHPSPKGWIYYDQAIDAFYHDNVN
jgi:D-alanine transfer protein